ncbi:MAG TPA: hypothetical protein VEU29_00855 [Actinomycetota bacterium]|nr:hypothetical protein [Actinomycetota bacterium]
MSAPPVRRVHPPRWLMKVVNPVVRWRLGRRVKGEMSRKLMVLHVTGLKSGRRYRIPVSRQIVAGRLCTFTDGSWRHNVRGGAALEVTIDGKTKPARAELEEDPGRIARVFLDRIETDGVREAQRTLGIRVRVDRNPTLHELRDEILRSGLSIVYVDVEG